MLVEYCRKGKVEHIWLVEIRSQQLVPPSLK